MKLIAILRTKNSLLKLEDCLEKLSLLVDEIIVMDNGSIDGTIEVLKKFPKIIKVLYRDDTGNFNEGRDMNLILDEAKKRNPDWITMAWPDEVFERNLTRGILEKYMQSKYDCVGFRMCHFWRSMKYCRFDRDWFFYTLRPQRFMWRNLEGTYFNNVVIHPGGIQGINSPVCTSLFRIKHYGYVNKLDVDRKLAVFKQNDPTKLHKYITADFENKESLEYILRYPFIEFDNKLANYFYIVFYKLICDMLLITVKIKRRYFRKLKFFRTSDGK
ncbi:MAG: glycosyltransferase [Patescibacteria group bacterium]